jgi:hypothetical protein
VEKKRSRMIGLFLLMLGSAPFFANLGKPGVEALRGHEIVGLMASGACFGVAIVALLGRLKLRND